jgi:hypothetical protein
MIVVCCNVCRLALRVIGEPAEIAPLVGTQSTFWPDKYPCPHCGYWAIGRVESTLSVEDLASFRVLDLGAAELFAALNGLGLPDEKACSLAVIVALFKEQPVRRVVGVDVPGTERCVLYYFELWDGTRIHLGASPEGAVVYRNVPPQSYVEKIHE